MLIRNILAGLPGEDEFRKVDIVTRGEKISRIATAGSLPLEAETVDGSGLMMFPGAIDPHVHFDEPGFTHREDFLHGTMEAARGGVTTVIDMPCTSLPPVVSRAALDNKLAIVEKSAVVDFAFFGGLSGLESDEEMERGVAELAPRVVGFKCYFISGMDSFTALTPERFATAAKLCGEFGRPILLHAEDPRVIAAAQAEVAARRGRAAPLWEDYFRSRPMEAEISACSAALKAAGRHAAYLHVVHVGTAKAAEALVRGGATCETCAHYLAFDETDFERLGATLKTAPPVKAPDQKALLWKLLANGDISFLTSDHAGAPDYEKFTENPLSAYGGIPGTGTMFPYLLSEGLLAGRLSLGRFLDATSGAAARRYGLSAGKGSLAPGKDADFSLVDPESVTVMEPRMMFSKSSITPFAGMRLSGKVVGTFVRGRRVFGLPELAPRLTGSFAHAPAVPGIESIFASPGSGKFLTWGY